jgi:site-specific recombinase XerD
MKQAKRSVEVVESFCGWDFLLKLLPKCKQERDRALISALFETGGRVSEVLQLKKDNFVVQEPYVVVKAMPVLKRYSKVGEFVDRKGRKRWRTSEKKSYRTFPIHMKEPLCLSLLEYIEERRTEKLFDIGRFQVYRVVRSLDNDIFPHWFRAQRASQLALEYGFDMHDLIDFFNWKSLQTATHYSHMGWKGLANKMRR